VGHLTKGGPPFLIYLPSSHFIFVNYVTSNINHMPTTTNKEWFTLNGENLVKKIKELINEGNVRKVTIHDKDGKELMSFPLTIGVVGTLLAPVLAAVGAVAALISECKISVEREEADKA